MALISVIVPVYNVRPYLEACVDSILRQTHRELEVLLVNDGSTDGSEGLCRELAARDPRIRVIDQPNRGLSEARNTGIDHATGAYLLFVDSDDLLPEAAVSRLLEALERCSAQLALGSFIEFDEKAGTSRAHRLPDTAECMSGRDILLRKAKHSGEWVWCVVWNRLYRRELFAELRFPSGRVHEDEYVFHHILRACARVACVPDVVYEYRRRADSIMGKDRSIRRLDGVEALLLRAMDYSGDPALIEAAAPTLFDAMYLYERYYRATRFVPDEAHRQRCTELQRMVSELAPRLKAHVGLGRRALLCLYARDVYRTVRGKVALSGLKQRLMGRNRQEGER